MLRAQTLDCDIASQKKKLAGFAGKALARIEKAEILLKDIHEGRIQVATSREDMALTYSEVQGILERLSSIDRWIEEEIHSDDRVANDESLSESYRTMMKNYCDKKKDYPGLKIRLSEKLEQLDAAIIADERQGQKPFVYRPPTPIEAEEVASEDEPELGTSQEKHTDHRNRNGNQNTNQNDSLIEIINQNPRQNLNTIQNGDTIQNQKTTHGGNGYRNEQEEKLKSMESRLEKMMETSLKKMMEIIEKKERNQSLRRSDTCVPAETTSTNNHKNKTKRQPIHENSSSEDEDWIGKRNPTKKNSKRPVIDSESDYDGYTTDQHYQGNSLRSRVRIRNVDVETFTGDANQDYEEWRLIFMRIFGNNKEYDSVDKLIYLKTYVSKEAKDLISHIKIARGNFKYAMEILDQTYKNEKKPKKELFYKFRSFSVEQKDHTQMMKDTGKLASIVFEMRNKGIDIDAEHIYITMIEKYPVEIREALTMKTLRRDFDGSFEQVFRWAKKMISAKIEIKYQNDHYGIGKKSDKTKEDGSKTIKKEEPDQKEGAEENQQDQTGPQTQMETNVAHQNQSDHGKTSGKGGQNGNKLFPKEGHQPESTGTENGMGQTICFKCGKPGHFWKKCRNPQDSQCEKCGGLHNAFFCNFIAYYTAHVQNCGQQGQYYNQQYGNQNQNGYSGQFRPGTQNNRPQNGLQSNGPPPVNQNGNGNKNFPQNQ